MKQVKMPEAVEMRAIDALLPYARNARTHSDAQVAQIAASMVEFGWTNPVLVDDGGTIIAGHGRVLAARKLGLVNVPCIVLSHLTDAQRRALVIADNRLALSAGWDDEMLASELIGLRDDGFAIPLLGFDDGELAALLATEKTEPAAPAVDKDLGEYSADALLAKWGVESGQIWGVGKHLVMCGDCTDERTVARVMGGERARVCLTDPPYGLGAKRDSGKNDYRTYDDTHDALRNLAARWLPLARSVADAVVFSPGVTNAWLYPQADWVLCWFYGGGQLRSSWGFNCWQPFLAYGKDPSLATGNGGRPDGVNLNVPARADDVDHPCPKPVALWEWFIQRLSFDADDLFYEPFCGSGTTLLACEKLGRRVRAIEIDPGYVAVTLQRFADAFGVVPQLVSDD